MSQIMTFAGIPAVVLLSFFVALGVEVVLLSSAIRLMGRAAQRAQGRQAVSRQDSAR
jgi:uncharacterized membrane protein